MLRAASRRTTVELAAGSSVIARMPGGIKRRAMQLDEGAPILEVRDATGEVKLLPGDEVELTRPGQG
ncbi:hypothetical protein O7614_27885 [Micromonospora sp. WMMD961]|uniref:hypothetical protein n=1 Tax=Micromonospora sp. WMMD961 TaxID=3016100 RepID=UPI002416A629|nr:hypothetical protein [Micromonospora sp. WMMD961]MDG4783480.1 hypothetical protein [Micromonospora sp. WMMD961]